MSYSSESAWKISTLAATHRNGLQPFYPLFSPSASTVVLTPTVNLGRVRTTVCLFSYETVPGRKNTQHYILFVEAWSDSCLCFPDKWQDLVTVEFIKLQLTLLVVSDTKTLKCVKSTKHLQLRQILSAINSVLRYQKWQICDSPACFLHFNTSQPGAVIAVIRLRSCSDPILFSEL